MGVATLTALTLPKINFRKRTIQLEDNLFYALYGRYPAGESLKKTVSWLTSKEVKFMVRDSKDGSGNLIHRIFLGGYETSADLERILASLGTEKR